MYVIWKISLAFFFPRQREPGDSLGREKCYCSWFSKSGFTSVFQWPLEDLDSSWMSVWFQVHLDWGITCHYNNSRGQLCFMTKKEKSFSASNCEFFLPALLLPGFHCIDFNHTSSEASLFQAGKSHCVQLLTLICFPPYFHLTYVASDGETQDQKHLLLSPPAAELQGLNVSIPFSFGLGYTLVSHLRRGLPSVSFPCFPVSFTGLLVYGGQEL